MAKLWLDLKDPTQLLTFWYFSGSFIERNIQQYVWILSYNFGLVLGIIIFGHIFSDTEWYIFGINGIILLFYQIRIMSCAYNVSYDFTQFNLPSLYFSIIFLILITSCV